MKNGQWTTNGYKQEKWRCSVKEAFLKILQNSQENTCVGVSFCY